MGYEGAGEIVEVGPGVDVSNIGKVVAFVDIPDSDSFTGTWRQFKTAKLNGGLVFIFPDSAKFD